MSKELNVFDGSGVSVDALRRTPVELEERRLQVLTLRLCRLPQRQIAGALKVDQSTISRDLQWIAQHWRERYGTPPGLDPAEEIGEAIAVFTDVEGAALRDYHRLTLDQAKQRNACLRMAILARQMRVNLLLDLGFLDRQIGNIGGTLGADTIRQALGDQGLLATDGGHLTVREDDGRATARQDG